MTGERRGARGTGWLRRVCYGRERLTLEPHYPPPWFWRGVSWSVLAAAPLLFASGLVLYALGHDDVGNPLGVLSVAAFVVGVTTRLFAELRRPAPLDLAPFDQER